MLSKILNLYSAMLIADAREMARRVSLGKSPGKCHERSIIIYSAFDQLSYRIARTSERYGFDLIGDPGAGNRPLRVVLPGGLPQEELPFRLHEACVYACEREISGDEWAKWRANIEFMSFVCRHGITEKIEGELREMLVEFECAYTYRFTCMLLAICGALPNWSSYTGPMRAIIPARKELRDFLNPSDGSLLPPVSYEFAVGNIGLMACAVNQSEKDPYETLRSYLIGLGHRVPEISEGSVKADMG